MKNWIKEIHRRLEQEAEGLAQQLKDLGAQRVILFGSLARGEVREDTDIDLLVILETPLPRMKRRRMLYESLDYHEPLDLWVLTPTEWEKAQKEMPFFQEVAKEGRVLL